MSKSKTTDEHAREICGVCRMEIEPGEVGVRSFGSYQAHSEHRCIYLLQARIEELKGSLATARAEGEAEGRAAAEGQVAMAMDCVRDLAKMPCRTVGVEDMEPGCCGPCRARDLLSATPASIAARDAQLIQQGRQEGLREAAEIAAAHKGSAAKKRKERGWKLSSYDEGAQQEIIAEERGEDIAADIIWRSIQAKIADAISALRTKEEE